MSTNPMNARKNVRAKLQLQVVLTGTDRQGNRFEITGHSADFSRKGLGVILDKEVLSQGSRVTVSSEGKLRSDAAVQWIRRDPDTGLVHAGLRLVAPRESIGFKIATSLLLFFAFLSQASFAGVREAGRAVAVQSSVAQGQQARPATSPTGASAIGSEIAAQSAEELSDQSTEAAQDTGRNLIEKAIIKADDAKPSSRQAVVNFHMSKNNYASGDTVAASVYRLSNPATSRQSVELKTWLAGPGIAPISVGNVGADGLYILPPGVDEQYGPLDLLAVRADLPGGKYEFSARMLDPVTGEIVGEHSKSFTLSTPQAESPRAAADGMPSVAIDCQVENSRYSLGDTVSLAGYRIANKGATSATIEVKVWLEAPALEPIAVFSLGADGSLELTPGADMNLEPLEPFKVTETLPAGNYQLKSRVLNPVTGETYSESSSSFEIR